MRKKKFVCKMTAVFLSAVLAVSGMTMDSQTKVHAAKMGQVQNEFRFGGEQTELSPGEYTLPVALKNAGDITKDSMAASCVRDGKLVINPDGTADITIGLQAVSVFGVTAWAENWAIYKTDLTGEKESAEATANEEGNVDSIKFRLPDNAMDGVYTDMYVSAMNTTMQAYFAFDYANAALSGGADAAEKKNGSAKVEQFGGYDVNVAVSVLEGKIADLEVEGANFEGAYADFNKSKLQAAVDGLKPSYIGKSATDAKGLEGIDAVSGATYSSDAIRSAVFHALGLEGGKEVITLPMQKLEKGRYQVDIAFYTDNVKHSLVENDKAKAVITADADGNMTLTTAVINGTVKEPLYFYDFNGYYEGNDRNGILKATDKVKKGGIDFSDDVFGAEEQVVTEVTFPLEGDFAEIYYTNASIYVPAMKNLTGELAGVTFDQGRFSSDCFAKVYWDSLEKVGPADDGPGFGSEGIELAEGTYAIPAGMKNASDPTKDSMAASCLRGAFLTVNPDGSATVTLDLAAVSVMGQTAWASDWKVFKEQNITSDTVDADVMKKDADGNVTQIAFVLPNNHADGVYVSMNAMGGRVMHAYLAIDFANATVKEEGLEDGVYAVEGVMYKPDLKTKSMADAAFSHTMPMTVQDGKASLTMNFKGMEITGFNGYLGRLKYYAAGYQKDAFGAPVGELKDVTVESVQKYSDGAVISDDFGLDYPDIISFEVIPEALEDGILPLQVFMPIMEGITAGTGNQNVYLKLDLEHMEKTTAEDERFHDTDTAPENPSAKPLPVDKTALRALIGTADAEASRTDAAYTSETLEALKAALANARAVAEKEDATAEEVQAQVKALDEAVKALERQPEPATANKAALQQAIAKAKGLAAQTAVYTADSIRALNRAITIAQEVYNNANALQADVDAQVTALNAAEKALVKQPENETPKVTKPAAPSKVKAASAAYNKIKLTWAAVSGANGYEVCQYNSSTKQYSRVASATGTSYTRGSLKTGQKYTFKIRAYKTVNGEKIYGSYSKAVSAKPTLSSAAGVKAKNSKKGTVLVSWKKVSGASGYEVYRSTKKSSGFKKVAAVKKGSTVKYTDKKLKKGRTYYYKVKAYRTVSGKKVPASYSKTVKVKIKK